MQINLLIYGKQLGFTGKKLIKAYSAADCLFLNLVDSFFVSFLSQ